MLKIPGYRSKTPWKMGVATFVYALILMIIVIAIIDPSSEETAQTGNKQVDKVGQADLKKMDPEEYAKYLVSSTLKKETNNDKERFVKALKTTNNYLMIGINADDNLTTNLMKTSMLLDSKELYEKAFKERPDFDGLRLVWYADLVDIKGNESVGSVMNITITKENASTSNWDNVIADNLPKIADEYWEHSLFSK